MSPLYLAPLEFFLVFLFGTHSSAASFCLICCFYFSKVRNCNQPNRYTEIKNNIIEMNNAIDGLNVAGIRSLSLAIQ